MSAAVLMPFFVFVVLVLVLDLFGVFVGLIFAFRLGRGVGRSIVGTCCVVSIVLLSTTTSSSLLIFDTSCIVAAILLLLRVAVGKGLLLATIFPSSSRSVAIAFKLTASWRVLLALLTVLLLLRELLISRWLLLLLRILVRASELITLLIVG